jgi:hypothetical protein
MLALVLHRNDLAGLGVVAESGGVRHADEFILDQRFVDFQGRRHHGLQRLACRAIGDDDVFAVEETVGTGREGRVGQRHRIGALHDIGDFQAAPPRFCRMNFVQE